MPSRLFEGELFNFALKRHCISSPVTQIEWANLCVAGKVRVPFLVKVPGVTDQPRYDHVTPALVDLVDLFPTVAGLAGLPAPEGVDGIDQSSVVLGTFESGTSSVEFDSTGLTSSSLCGHQQST